MTADRRAPWSVVIVVDDIPPEGEHLDLATDAAQRSALSELAGVKDISATEAHFDLKPAGAGRIRATGTVRGRVGQTCVVTLEPMESAIEETVDVLFAPEDQIESILKAMEEAEARGGAMEVAADDPPEPIVGGRIDLGKLATDVLFLAIDPYPRKEGAVFEAPVEPEDPESHPFAALKALKEGGTGKDDSAKRKKGGKKGPEDA